MDETSGNNAWTPNPEASSININWGVEDARNVWS
jgi:hypothetical protein